MDRNNKKTISYRPGLFLAIAKQRGYSVIQFDPSIIKISIFSTNCRLSCKIIDSYTQTNCKTCGLAYILYRDPIMLLFERKVRLDLINNKFCYIPCGNNQWQQLPNPAKQFISNIQYTKAVATIKENQKELKQCLINYYNYKILPLPSPKSFWQNYQITKNQQSFLMKKGAQSINVVIGDKQIVQLDYNEQFNGQIICYDESHQFLAILCKNKEYSLFLYEIPQNNMCFEPLKPFYSLKINIDFNASQHFIHFFNQQLHLVFSQPKSRTVKHIKIPNILSYHVQMFYVHQQDKSQNQNNDFWFPIINFLKDDLPFLSSLTLSSQQICFNLNSSQIRIKNSEKMLSFDGMIFQRQMKILYLYKFQEKDLKLMKLSYNPVSIETKTIPQQNFVFQQLQFLESEDPNIKNKIIGSRPVIDGFILYCNMEKEDKIFSAKTCIL